MTNVATEYFTPSQEGNISEEILKTRRKEKINAYIRYTILIIIGFIMLYPLIWLVGASFKQNYQIFSEIHPFPTDPTLDGYIEGWKTGSEYTFTTYFLNTFQIIIPKVIFTIVSATLVAYGFARFDIPFKKFLFATLIATILLPQTVLRIPQYLMFREFGWLDTFMPLYIPSAFATDAFFVFMLIQFLRGTPRDMEEAAFIDGCNSFQVLIYVIFPIIKPAIIAVGLFQFMWSMNDFMGPLIYLSSVEKYPIALALKMSIDVSSAVEWNRVLAMSTLSLLPSIVIFFFAQRYFVGGVMTTGVKG